MTDCLNHFNGDDFIVCLLFQSTNEKRLTHVLKIRISKEHSVIVGPNTGYIESLPVVEALDLDAILQSLTGYRSSSEIELLIGDCESRPSTSSALHRTHSA